jgi:putative SOS response-associated peptidase YedK
MLRRKLLNRLVRLNRDTGMREIALMRWGLIPYWSKDAKIAYSTINAKAETAATAPALRRRCLWERWKDPASREWLETFSILTTDPDQVAAPLHNRMPVIIERKHYARWLGGSDTAQPPLDLLRPFPAEQMTAWKVDKAVGNVRNDAAKLLEPPVPEDCAGRDL